MATAHSFIIQETIEPVIIVSADNSPGPFGGSWYVNSILWGNYEDFMMNDLVSWIDYTYRTIPEKDGRALMGQSMGCVGSFRYGILYKEMLRVIAGHAGPMIYDVDLWLESARQQVLAENQPGPPYSVTFATGGSFTQGSFLLSGAFSPNLNSTQTYINPQNVDYIFDENGEFIDSLITKWQTFDVNNLIYQLTPEDSVGIYFGCGTNDEWLLYPALSAFADTLEMLGLPFEFYFHNGGHSMPYAFKTGALNFIDSLLMSPGIYTTSCLPEGITFTTQEEIDNFQINHPDCTEIEGDAIIGVDYGSTDITNLSGLENLTSIGGDLSIECNDTLANLGGLNNLSSINGSLLIKQNSSLESTIGLESLISVGNYFSVSNNVSLVTISGPDNLISVEGYLLIEENSSLENIYGFEVITTIGEYFSVSNNDNLTSLSNLNNLNTIGEYLQIEENNILENIAGLEKLNSIEGDLIISNNNNLQISGNVSLSNCAVESICEYLASPTGSITINNNAPGCNNQQQVEDACWVNIDELVDIGNDIQIFPNPARNEVFISVKNRVIINEINIYNQIGQRVIYKKGKTNSVDISMLRQGMYIIEIEIDDGKLRSKLIIE